MTHQHSTLKRVLGLSCIAACCCSLAVCHRLLWFCTPSNENMLTANNPHPPSPSPFQFYTTFSLCIRAINTSDTRGDQHVVPQSDAQTENRPALAPLHHFSGQSVSRVKQLIINHLIWMPVPGWPHSELSFEPLERGSGKVFALSLTQSDETEWQSLPAVTLTVHRQKW